MIPRVLVSFFLVSLGLFSLRVTGACANEASQELSDSEVSEARMEYVKQRILKKLRLSRKPDVAMRNIPVPVAQGATLGEAIEENTDPPEFDDYYGRTNQRIIFPVEGECLTAGRYPYSCLQFELPPDIVPEEVTVVELWFYKLRDPLDKYNQTFVISEAAHWDKQKLFRKTKPIAMNQTDVSEGWVRVELAWAFRVWLESGDRLHTLHVACRTCQLRRAPLSMQEKRRPFLVLYTKYAGKRRHSRTLECTPSTSECCRKPLYVSFEKLGWGDFILEPKGYKAYYCQGDCAPITAAAHSASHHSNLIRKYAYASSKERDVFKPCCVPTKFSSLQLLYLDSNSTATLKTLPNMVVESCGCL